MLSTDLEAVEIIDSNPSPAHFFVVRGRKDILRIKPVLVSLSLLCGQKGAADFLEYFLTNSDGLNKIPYLLLVSSRSSEDVSELRAEDMAGAALIYEYTVMGFPSGLFSTRDFNGLRGIIAPAATRAKISAMICRYLAEHGARVVHVTFAAETATFCRVGFDEATEDSRNQQRWWTVQSSEVGGSIAIGKTMDATLANIGRHTRRNLRYYRRKTEGELGCIFHDDLRGILTMALFRELNSAATHPVTESVLKRRFAVMNSMEGSFCAGIKTGEDQLISLLGGRRHHSLTEIDWQMNRGGLSKYSIGTVTRSFLIEDEIKIGTERLSFEGGTMHTLRYSFLPQKAVDIVVRNQDPFVSLLRRFTVPLRLDKCFLFQTLANPGLKWHLR
jgi:hypothetical protein